MKLPAAHIGILFAGLSLYTFGWRALARRDLWFFATLSLLIPLGWYAHARGFWLEYGNSLGMSNEAFVRIESLSFFRALRSTLPGLIRIELSYVFMYSGVFLAALGLWALRSSKASRVLPFWILSLAAFYFVSGRTTGESWAYYYHIFSVPAATLLMGLGIDFGTQSRARAAQASPTDRPGGVGPRWLFASRALYALTLLALSATAVYSVWQIKGESYLSRAPSAHYECAILFKDTIPEGTLVAASAPSTIDQHGLLRASNPPHMFYWMDRKGLNVPENELDVEIIEDLRSRGLGFLIAETQHLAARGELGSQLENAYSVKGRCENLILFDLTEKVSPKEPVHAALKPVSRAVPAFSRDSRGS
jgi:hypothetical protein